VRRCPAATPHGSRASLANPEAPWYKPAQRMRDQAHMTCSTLAGLGWSDYARYYAWRFS